MHPRRSYRRVVAGDQIQFEAAFVNDLISLLSKRVGTKSRPRSFPQLPGGCAWIRNDSGGDRSRGEVLAIVDHSFGFAGAGSASEKATYLQTPSFVGTTPGDPSEPWALLLEPIASGKWGIGRIAGLASAPCTINDAADEFLGISAASHTLVSGSEGDGEIMHSQVDSDVAWFRMGAAAEAPTPATMVMARADSGQSLLPGDTAGKTFSRYSWSGSALVDSGVNITVKDPLNQNCYLEGEYGWFQPQGGDYLPVGSHGLFRLAESDSNILADASDTAQFYVNGAVSTINVTIWNSYPGYNRQIEAGYNDRAFIWYDASRSKWIILPPPLAQFATGTVSDALEPQTTTPAIGSFDLQDWNAPTDRSETAPASGTGLTNDYKHASESGGEVLLWRKTDARSAWIPVDVEKILTKTVEDLRLHSNDYIQTDLLDKVWAEAVSPTSTWTDEIFVEDC